MIPNAWNKNSDARNFHQEARSENYDARSENYDARSEHREPPYNHRKPPCDQKWHIYHQEMMHLPSESDTLSISNWHPLGAASVVAE